jgi:DHA1 family inner membrane transport protein
VPEGRPRWGDALLVTLCQSSQALAFGGIALFLPIIRRELDLSFTQAGGIEAVSTVVYACMQIPAGLLADRLGPKRLFIAGLLGVNVLTITFALLHSYELMMANQALQGVFRSLIFAPGLVLIGSLFPPERRATAMGLYIAGGFSGNVFLSLLGPPLEGAVGWRTLFLGFASLALVVLAVFWRRSPPEVRPTGERMALGEVLALFRHGAMWLLAGIQYVRLAVLLGLNVWLPTLIVTERGHSLAFAGAMVAMSAALTAPANILGGVLSDRIGRPRAVIGGSLAGLAAGTFLLSQVTSTAGLVAVLAFNAVLVQLYFGPLFALPIAMVGPRAAGVVSGFGNFFANVGGFTFILVLGAVKDATGSFDAGLHVLCGACLAGVALTVALGRARPVPAERGTSGCSGPLAERVP